METGKPSHISKRLTDLAREHFGDPDIEIKENAFTPAYGMTLEEMLDDPRLGEAAVIDYLSFKMAGGYE